MHELPQLLGVIGTIFWIWMLIDCFRNRGLRGGGKIVWLLLIFFLHWLGALIYFFVARSSKNRVYYTPPQWQNSANRYTQYNPPPVYRPPTPTYQPPPSPPVYRPYEQGYEALPPERSRQVEESTSWKSYEEPQASYPQVPEQEMPPQQQT